MIVDGDGMIFLLFQLDSSTKQKSSHCMMD